jgi:uncharacterized protein
MWFPRAVTDRLNGLLQGFPVVVLSGARQTGKTALLRQAVKGFNYVSLDLPSLASLAETESDRFLREYPRPLIVDEVQYAPGLFRHVKRAVDEQRSQPGQFILTGSQKFTLMREVSDSLAGRCAWLELEPLSSTEIRAMVPIAPSQLPAALARGFFPELWRQRDLGARDYYASYLATYLERDVREILNVTSLRDFERFIRIAAARSGQLLNKSDIAKDVGVSVKTIGEWISVLGASNQVVLLEPYYQNIAKRMVKSPKLYFGDPGLLCYLLGLDERSLESSPYLGAVWETFLFAELRKSIAAHASPFTIWYYRDQRAREIDFVLEGAGELRFVEAKWTEAPSSRDVATIHAVDEDLRGSALRVAAGSHAVVCRTAHRFAVTPRVTALSYEDLPEVLAPVPRQTEGTSHRQEP